MNNVYLDNNATTQVAPEVLEAMMPFFTDWWGNPSSMHVFGGQVRKHVDQARQKVAALIGADPSEIIFTSCGTESDNMATRGAVDAAGERVNIITTRVEHLAVLEPCRMLKERGYRVMELDVDGGGNLNLDVLRQALSLGQAVVSIMWANNETGVIFPIPKIAETVKAAGGVMHTDAVQAVGKLAIDVCRMPVDMLALSGHKLHAPKGVGALYIRKGTRVRSLMLGGHQESGRRGGTENVPYIVGLGRACELAARNMHDEMTRVAALRDRLQQGILATCPDVRINGDPANRLPNTLNISFLYIEGESILYHLSDCGIAASSGSACTSGSLEPSHVIRAMGVPFMAAHGSIRFSLSRYNTEADIDYVLARIPEIIRKLRAISPFAPV
ncbi:MAG: cysteine desulfurase NifS [Verrucomicrobia bacterium]|nr:cysteine desulfurase NifS [Verrucomicrobiota bacterium]MCG2680833.1 cysteine desulfurase NifS [Kiritimatiellia bacterium]MBU4246843.1 cysteine desulfurase NifS [Verrucomicrobiota bacterium]MBU4290411.1 cysteine desulfurase NifS [Verrucomicrobiota bacterium]MBU4430262.1 cysteine desulfurase NifS [Verrucomicrobiota bacterium]